MDIGVDGSLLIQILNFVVLILAMNAVLYKPLRRILKERKDLFDGLETSIAKMNEEGLACLESVRAGIREARLLGAREKNLVLEAALEDEKNQVAKMQEELRKDFDAFCENLKSERDEAERSLAPQIDTFALAIGEKILGRAI